MRFGPKCEDGFLPVYSVADEEEAKALLTLACSTNFDGEYIAKQLVMEQTLENLESFSAQLDRAHTLLVKSGGCRCEKKKPAPKKKMKRKVKKKLKKVKKVKKAKRKVKKKVSLPEDLCVLCGDEVVRFICYNCSADCCEHCIIFTGKGDFCVNCAED